jgi:DNA-binding transcriptional regulator GbsR (MarR family)
MKRLILPKTARTWQLQNASKLQEQPMSDELQYRLTESDEYEEISSDEVDRVVEALDRLIAGVQSENVKHYLEEAASNIYFLVYEEEAEEELDETAEQAA